MFSVTQKFTVFVKPKRTKAHILLCVKKVMEQTNYTYYFYIYEGQTRLEEK